MNVPTPPNGAMARDDSPKKGLSVGSIPPRVWVALALLVVAALFVAQNRDSTEIQILLVSLTAPLWATLTLAVAIGMAAGLLLRPSERKGRRASKK